MAETRYPLDFFRGLPIRRDDRGYVLLSYAGVRYAHFVATYCVHTKGRWARRPILMEPWQIIVFSELLHTEPGTWLAIPEEDLYDPWEVFAEAVERPWFDVETGRRKYHEAYLQMPEKTGKSTILSSLELYLTGFDGEEGAEVYAAATTGDQAGIVFGQAKRMVERSPELRSVFNVYASVIYHGETDSVFKVLASEAAHDEGLNPHGVCIDELWAHHSRDLYDTLTSRLDAGTRLDPLAVTITNAGVDREGIAYEVYSQAKAVLEGRPDARDDLFAFVPELTGDELDHPSEWKRVNPQSWIDVEHLLRSQRKQPQFVFRRRRLNVWTAAENAWLPDGAWDACRMRDEEGHPTGLTVEDGDPVYAGVDLGLKRDTAAVTCCAPREDGTIETWTMVWGLVRREEADPPAHYLTNDARLNISLVEEYLRDLARKYDLREIAYDPYRFERSAQTLADEGFVMVEWPQTDQRMIPATEGLYEDVTEARIRHDGDDVFRQHVEAGEAVETGRGVRLTKRKAKRPMDALIGLTMSRARAVSYFNDDRPRFDVLV
jgi:phage terminase large subunit-like protein